MRKTLQQILDTIKTFNVGDKVSVLTPNGTMHVGAARFYKRTGIFNGVIKDKWNRDCLVLLVGKTNKKYKFSLVNHWTMKTNEDGTRREVRDEFCEYILDICKEN